MTEDTVKTEAREIAIPMIAEFEGYRDKSYDDSTGVWTLGFGTTHYPDGSPVRPGDTCTKEQAKEWLRHDLGKFEDCIDRYVKVPLTVHHRAVLTSFVYNLGCGSLQKSTLLKKLNRGDYEGAADELPKWCHAGGRKLKGLVRRRKAERDLFLS
jgi:lysozyme